jgi:hypothetical protein
VRKRPRLTRARLRELLHYNPQTGEFRWHIRSGNEVRLGDSAGYVQISIRRRTYRAHQLAWFYMTGRWCRPTIDHRDGDSTNNRWSNLRRATQSQNNANRRRPRQNTSGFKGVYLCRTSGKWCARVRRNGRAISLGYYSTPQAAHAAYVAAARKLYGEFARME